MVTLKSKMEGGHKPPFLFSKNSYQTTIEKPDHFQQTTWRTSEMNTATNNQTGFTLIELMIVVAIIGILSSIAMSSYQTYTVRAQVTEGLNLAGNAKTPIVDSFLSTGEAPANRTDAGMSPNPGDTFGKYVQSVAVNNGRVDVVFGNEANTSITNTTLSLTPYETTDGSVIWRCGQQPAPGASGPSVAVPLGSKGTGNAATYQTSTVNDRYLPSTCR
jgi:type IV pilus assembly protein PilA